MDGFVDGFGNEMSVDGFVGSSGLTVGLEILVGSLEGFIRLLVGDDGLLVGVTISWWVRDGAPVGNITSGLTVGLEIWVEFNEGNVGFDVGKVGFDVGNVGFLVAVEGLGGFKVGNIVACDDASTDGAWVGINAVCVVGGSWNEWPKISVCTSAKYCACNFLLFVFL